MKTADDQCLCTMWHWPSQSPEMNGRQLLDLHSPEEPWHGRRWVLFMREEKKKHTADREKQFRWVEILRTSISAFITAVPWTLPLMFLHHSPASFHCSALSFWLPLSRIPLTRRDGLGWALWPPTCRSQVVVRSTSGSLRTAPINSRTSTVLGLSPLRLQQELLL